MTPLATALLIVMAMLGAYAGRTADRPQLRVRVRLHHRPQSPHRQREQHVAMVYTIASINAPIIAIKGNVRRMLGSLVLLVRVVRGLCHVLEAGAGSQLVRNCQA